LKRGWPVLEGRGSAPAVNRGRRGSARRVNPARGPDRPFNRLDAADRSDADGRSSAVDSWV